MWLLARKRRMRFLVFDTEFVEALVGSGLRRNDELFLGSGELGVRAVRVGVSSPPVGGRAGNVSVLLDKEAVG